MLPSGAPVEGIGGSMEAGGTASGSSVWSSCLPLHLYHSQMEHFWMLGVGWGQYRGRYKGRGASAGGRYYWTCTRAESRAGPLVQLHLCLRTNCIGQFFFYQCQRGTDTSEKMPRTFQRLCAQFEATFYRQN